VVDTVGAGDAFVSGWLRELTRGASAAERLDTAIVCGALACTASGDWEAAPTAAEVERRRAGRASDPRLPLTPRSV
jgi:2-dehydro-3-deoxygluconokinase